MKSIALVTTLFISAFASAALADVRCVQEYLSKTAFDPGPIDGVWGRKTASALKDFISQVEISIDGGLGKGNAVEICRVLKADTNQSYLIQGKYRTYAIEIDDSLLSDIDPEFFDFSGFEMYNGADLTCSFEISQERPKGGILKKRAEGYLEIVRGRLSFGRHDWTLGDDKLADETYLTERSNLAILKTGQIVGKMPYFWSHIQEGGVSKRPINTTLSTAFESWGEFPIGGTSFEVPGKPDMTGVFTIDACRNKH